MKHVSKSLGLVFMAAALLLSACAKKPVRSATPDSTQTGQNIGINPEQIAVGPDSTLVTRDPNAGIVPDANKSVVDPIYFAFDRFAVPPAERPKLQAAIKWLADNPEKNLVLVGHCDWRGTAEYNLGLGDRRAQAVKQFLQTLGVPADRLQILSKGSLGAVEKGSEDQMSKDRRAEFVILKK